MKHTLRISLLFIGICFCQLSFSQSTNFWSAAKEKSIDKQSYAIQTNSTQVYQLDFDGLSRSIQSSGTKQMNVPLPDGRIISVTLSPSKIMSESLSKKYPNIRAYRATNEDGISGMVDITHKGFHGFFYTPQGTVYIDPINDKTTRQYQVYYRQDYLQKDIKLLENDIYDQKGVKIKTKSNSKASSRTSGTELRQYRLAITATGEYTQFHGGTVEDGLAAIVTTMNRVTGIYEREVSITFQLIDDTDLLIFTDPNSDPYNNEAPDVYINQVQQNIDDIIGNANYDIGHGFSTGAGGLAGAGPCITGQKATGVTGIANPIGDPFDVDFVAHEIGHQFSANHTFNGTTSSCAGNRNGSTAYEPGSGTSILAYAGICASQNIQSNSDPFFHTASYDEILSFSVDGPGNDCATITSTTNNPPTVDAGAGSFTIPINTPFTLNGSGADPDGDDLTFSWEQFDLGPAGAPNDPEGNAPLFRSFSPKDTSARTFPDIADIISNNQTLGEILPSYSRSLSFRLTARDNKNGGGGVNYDEISFEVTEEAGPFLVNSFNTSTALTAQSNVTITWDVANTDNAEVNCQSVNILLSTDGGLTYPTSLAENIPNNGTSTILIPDIQSTTARLKVEAADNIFFDINDANITIEEPSSPDFFIDTQEQTVVVCSPDAANFELAIGSVLGFSEEVNLSIEGLNSDLTSNFSQNPVPPGSSTTITISETAVAEPGIYTFDVIAAAGGETKVQNLTVEIINLVTDNIEVTNPVNEAIDVPLFTAIEWSEIGSETLYDFDLAIDEDFITIIESETGQSSNLYQPPALNENTTYFFRVRGTNKCGTSEYSVSSFTTSSPICLVFDATDTPLSISSSGPQTVVSEILVTENGSINDINILNLTGSHSFVSDLTITLESPDGTVVTLFDGICGNSNDFSLTLDDEADTAEIPCPPTDGGAYIPAEFLSQFNGESSAGIWRLTVQDNFNLDGGELSSWSLEVCATFFDLPLNPDNLEASVVNDFVELTWDDNSDNEEGFIVERSIADEAVFEVLDSLDANEITFTDNTIVERNTFTYRVKAFNEDGESGYSNEVIVVFTPDAPTELSSELISINQINLTWIDNSTNETEFIIERSASDNTNFEDIATLRADVTDFQDNTLEDPNVYFYRVKAVNEAGQSIYSNEVEESTLILSVEQKLNTEINVFPNPSSGIFYLNLSGMDTEVEVIVFDLLGNELNYQQRVLPQKIEIDLSQHPDGLYHLLILNQDQTQSYKLIKSSYK